MIFYTFETEKLDKIVCLFFRFLKPMATNYFFRPFSKNNILLENYFFRFKVNLKTRKRNIFGACIKITQFSKKNSFLTLYNKAQNFKYKLFLLDFVDNFCSFFSSFFENQI